MAFGVSPEIVEKGYEFSARLFDNQETTNELLKNIADNSGPGVQTLAVTEREVGGGIEVDFPVEGGTRWLIPRLATGGSFTVPQNEYVRVLEANNRRLGGTIVNRGSSPVILILANPNTAASQAGLGELYLSALGGSWDFRLGSLLWCGSVCAYGDEGESTVSIVEV